MDNKIPEMVPVGPSAEEAVKQQQEIVNKINKDRYQGIKRLEGITESFDQKMGTFQDALPGRIVELQSAIRATHTTLNALNTMNNMLANDLIDASGELEQLKFLYFQVSTHLQTMTNLLIKQGVMTEDEFRKEWDEVVEVLRNAEQPSPDQK